VQDMRIGENGDSGVHNVTNGLARIVNSTISLNGFDGIACANACRVEGNTISNNKAYGVYFNGTGTALGNTVISNTGYGIYGAGKVGYGNNTIIDNGAQVGGNLIKLHPNACSPVAC